MIVTPRFARSAAAPRIPRGCVREPPSRVTKMQKYFLAVKTVLASFFSPAEKDFTPKIVLEISPRSSRSSSVSISSCGIQYWRAFCVLRRSLPYSASSCAASGNFRVITPLACHSSRRLIVSSLPRAFTQHASKQNRPALSLRATGNTDLEFAPQAPPLA